MPSTSVGLRRLPIYGIASLCLLGAFTRITHGVLTPRIHRWQEYHRDDEEGIPESIVALIEVAIGLGLFNLRSQLIASLAAFSMFTITMAGQLDGEKEFRWDVVIAVLSFAAVYGSVWELMGVDSEEDAPDLPPQADRDKKRE